MKHWICGIVCLLGAIVLTACGGGQPSEPLSPQQQYAPDDTGVRQVLRFMPASAKVALAIPSFDILDKEFTKIADAAGPAAAGLKEASAKLGEMWGAGQTATLNQLASGLGIDPTQPAVVFQLADDNRAGVLCLKDAKVFEEKIGGVAKASFTSMVLKTSWHSFLTRSNTAMWCESAKLGYFIKDNKAFVATTQELLIEFVARQTVPASIAYGLGEYPGKGQSNIVAIMRFGEGINAYLEKSKEAGKYLKALGAYFGAKCDEAILSLDISSEPAVLRIAAHETAAPTAADLPALSTNRLFPPDSPALLNLRLSNGISELFTALSAKSNGLGDAGKIIGTAGNIIGKSFGEEIAAAITGVVDGQPQWLVLAPIKDATLLKLPLSIVGASKPSYEHQSIPIHIVNKPQMVPFQFFIGMGKDMLFASNSEDLLKKSVERYAAAEQTPAWVPAEVLENGRYGFAITNPASVQSIVKEGISPFIPADLDLSGGNVSILLDSKQGWRQATLTIAGAPEILKKAVPVFIK